MGIAFAIGLVILIFIASQFIGGGDDNVSTADGTSTTASGAPVSITVPPTARFISDTTTPCPAADGSTERATSFANPPQMCIDPAKTYKAKVETTDGDFTIDLDAKNSPLTTNNFVVLSRYHYYDGVAFHRIIPGFVVQGGDAKGPTPGTGDAGYKIPDELPTGEKPYYPVGTIAMANSSSPNTGGTQFFITTGQQGADLPPSYARFGHVSEGMDVVKKIEAVGTPEGAVTKEIKIKKVTISES